jgi:hypothetical protein
MPNYEDEAFYGAEWEPTEHLRQFREAHDLLIEPLTSRAIRVESTSTKWFDSIRKVSINQS